MFDRDGKGLISAHHFRQVMKQVSGGITDAEISDMLREADPSQSGVIDYHGTNVNKRKS